jgi:hypothetical protein
MQNGKSRATAGSAADVKAAQHTISIRNALRMTLSPLRPPYSVCEQTGLIDSSQFTFARGRASPRDQ